MPVPSVSSMFFHEYSCREVFSFVNAAGLIGLEFWIETPDFWLRDQPVGEVLAARKDFPAVESVTVHAPILDLNPCSINPRVAGVSLEYALLALRLAERLGAGILTVHPGRRTAKRPPSRADFDRFDHYLAALRDAAKSTAVRISMENMEPIVNSVLCTPERMRAILDAEPWLSFTLDVSHALAGRPGDCDAYIRTCGDRLANVHLSRIGGGRLHLPLDNDPVMAGVIRALVDAGYDGPITLEIDDLNFPGPLTAQEKVSILASDRAFIETTWGKSR